MLILGLLLTLVNICKFPYLTMCLLMFFIPKEKFEVKKTIFTYFGSIFILNLIIDFVFIGSSMLLSRDVVLVNSTLNVPIQEMLKIVSANPMFYVQLLYEKFVLSCYYYIQGAFAFFGWSDTEVPLWIIQAYLIMMSLCGLVNDNREPEFKITVAQKTILATIFVVMTLVTSAVTFSIYGEKSGSEIFITTAKLFQGRYWLPLLPIIFLMFNSSKLRFNLKVFKFITMGIFSFLLFVCTIVLLYRYYV